MPNPQNVSPFEAGVPISASSLNGLRAGVAKRVRGLIGRSSSYSAATAQSTQTVRERIEILNNTGQSIPAYSLFAVKKSGTINYPWGPPVRTEAFDSQVGFNYVTNYDYAIADTVAYQCLQVGSEPNLIRYTVADGIPKIGHPIGPLQDGSVSIKRCGYVVIAEPDTENSRVWIVKSNDQQIRVKLHTDIAACERGSAYLLGEANCAKDQNINDPNLVTSAPSFDIREILNLTGRVLVAATIHYAKPLLGIGLAITSEYNPIFKVKSTYCFYPGDTNEFTVLQLNTTTDEFEEIPNVTVEITDDYNKFFLFPGEVVDAAIYLDENGAAKYKLIGSYGLTRQGKLPYDIDCYSTGLIVPIKHESVSGEIDCDGIPICEIEACNGATGEEGRRTLYEGETVTIVYFESTWKILPQPHETEWLGTLTEDLCPDAQVGQADIDEVLEYCEGVKSVGQSVSFDNLFGLSGKAGMRVLLGAHEGQQGPVTFAKQVQHVCKHIVVPVGGCDEQSQAENVGKFIKYEDCKILGHVLMQTSQMYCGDEEWTDQIQLYEHTVLANATLGPGEQSICNYTLYGQLDTFCAFEEQEPDPPVIPRGTTQFNTTTMWDQLQLNYDPGDLTSGSEPYDECFSPALSLKGRAREVIVCDNCDTLDPENPNGPGYQCTGWGQIEWVENDDEWVVSPGYEGSCNCENCHIELPTEPPGFGESIYRIVNCTCIDPENPYLCCEGTDPPTEPVECALENITSLPLTLSTAYYRIEGPATDSQGRKCVYLVPIGFVTFGDCGEGDPEELICGNPCPDEDSGS